MKALIVFFKMSRLLDTVVILLMERWMDF